MKNIICRQFIIVQALTYVFAGCGGGDGKDSESDQITISFSIPEYYDDIITKTGNYIIEEGKTVNIYGIMKDHFDSLSDNIIIESDFLGSGLTGSGAVNISISDSFKNSKRYIIAIAGDSFDFKGKTMADIKKAVADGIILWGQTKDSNGNAQLIELTDNSFVNSLKFAGCPGKTRVCSIEFTMPSDYYNTFDAVDSIRKIPAGKEVYFYTIDSIGDPLISDSLIYKGKTSKEGGALSFVMPDSLKGKEKYIYSIIILSGAFDLNGSEKCDLENAIINGDILFGKIYPDAGGSEIVSLKEKNVISNLKYIGK
ncbi:MAG TPA: hypothetical protein PLE16_03665 [Spirochaetota bacterium]|nr:hypothetical protein [Spirochaetota bacterium]HOH36945.1 hypothetical protein [Spirochaetota bacterium]HPJ14532.1 hypothetical protein [Spirochaetota bacterium]HPM33680.1 hypothetical protein [Spirochaetota bacterium]HPY03058.1 hypothetical protein [Spirochaetota bacterium]